MSSQTSVVKRFIDDFNTVIEVIKPEIKNIGHIEIFLTGYL